MGGMVRRGLVSSGALAPLLGMVLASVACAPESAERPPPLKPVGPAPGVGGDPSPPGDGTASPYRGRWAGMTSQELSFSFVVEDGGLFPGVSTLEYGWKLPGCDWSNAVTFAEPAPIINDKLTVTMETPGSSTEFSIDFLGPQVAMGKMTFSVSDMPNAPACKGAGQATFMVTRR